MSRATAALISYIAQQTTNGGTVVLDEIIFANIPNLTEAKLTDTMPTTAQIVHRQAVSQTGFVNNNAVVYSVTLGTEVGDFNFNYIGLINKSKNLLGVAVYTDTIKKTANRNGVQGNAITRSILLEFNGAQALTNITIPAQTWQIDFTARLSGMDEALRLSNVDFYGSAAYYGDALKPTLSGNNLTLAAGVAYIGGLRVNFPATTKTITSPCKLYLDVYETGTVTGAHKVTANVVVQPATQSAVANYKDAQGVQHYIHYFLTVEANGALKDSRVRYWINWHNLKNVPNASTTAKGITALDSSVTSTAEDKAATPKAVKTAYDKGVQALNAANGKWTAQTATTARQGITQLDSSVSSTAEDKAATPKAVKTAYDKGVEALSVANSKVSKNGDEITGSLAVTGIAKGGFANGFKIKNLAGGQGTSGYLDFFQTGNVPRASLWFRDVGNGGCDTEILTSPYGSNISDDKRELHTKFDPNGNVWVKNYGWLHEFFAKQTDNHNIWDLLNNHCFRFSDIGGMWYPNHYNGTQTYRIRLQRNAGLLITVMKIKNLGEVDVWLPERYTGFAQVFITDDGRSRLSYAGNMISQNQFRFFGHGNGTNANVLVIGWGDF